MKLLLTSAGLANKTIIKALQKLAEKPFNKLKLAFVPTAANIEEGDKTWLIEDLNNCKNLGFKEIDIVDISALEREIILKRLEDKDIIFFGGGNNNHLIKWIEKCGLKDRLVDLLTTKIYIGLSAGSMIAGNVWKNKYDALLYKEAAEKDLNYLKLVDFMIVPHLNNPAFPEVNLKNVSKIAAEIKTKIYLLDDESAVVINEDEVNVISEGNWFKFN